MKARLIFLRYVPLVIGIGWMATVNGVVRGGVPQSSCVQGYLQDLMGNPVDGQVTFEVCIYDALTGGTIVWPDQSACIPSPPCCQTMPDVPVVDGLFAICPGDNDLTPQVFGPAGSGPQPRWLEVRTFGEPMIPRIELHSAPYSFRTGFVDNPELTDHVELGGTVPGHPGSLVAFNGAGAATVLVDGANASMVIGTDSCGDSCSGSPLAVSTNGPTHVFIANNNGGSNLPFDPQNNFASLEFGGRFDGQLNDLARIYAYYTGDGITRRSALGLATSGSDGNVNRIYITDTGNVGIGTTNPSEKLQVCGNVKVSGSYMTGGCDVAEAFELSEREKIEPGMVMVLDENRPGHLRISTQAYDTKVAGIVSGAKGLKPGVLLGGGLPEPSPSGGGFAPTHDTRPVNGAAPENGTLPEPSASAGGSCAASDSTRAVNGTAPNNNDLPIALSGRVYCYVDATQHAIATGDLLTTSDTPGHAMKVTDFARSQGAVLGKAMEPLEKSQRGLILVLVALQ